MCFTTVMMVLALQDLSVLCKDSLIHVLKLSTEFISKKKITYDLVTQMKHFLIPSIPVVSAQKVILVLQL